jgi:hypothetical protein
MWNVNCLDNDLGVNKQINYNLQYTQQMSEI